MNKDSFITEAHKDFLTYTEEVLTDRAVPAAEDGLLSAQRKILWTMKEQLKMTKSSKTKKCNSIVGTTLMTSYVHGDQACYGVLVKMAQEFLMRYPLVTGQGALGTQESNDMVASSRYTEAKPSQFADLMMLDYKKKVVPTKRTYNDEYDEPVVLPSLFPNAICNGKQTIAIGLAHNSLPHNLTEVCNALIAFNRDQIKTVDDVLEYISGPDFPLGGTVINVADVREAFRTGKSKVSLKVRGDYEIIENDIIFTSIPYRTYRNKIKEQINKNIDEFEKVLSDFDDESNLGQNKMVFRVKKGISPDEALAALFKYTDLQSTVSYNMNYIVNGTPKLCSMIDLLAAYSAHQDNVIINTATYDLNKAEARKHILEGLLVAVGDIDTAIKLIRNAHNKMAAKIALTSYFEMTERQADAVLDMRLSKLTKLEKEDLEKELKEKVQIIKNCNELLNNTQLRKAYLCEQLENLKKEYGDSRRTKLLNIAAPSPQAVKKKDIILAVTNKNTIKVLSKKDFKTQGRGGKGKKTRGYATMISTTNVCPHIAFAASGKYYAIEPIDGAVVAPSDEKIVSIVPLDDKAYLYCVTKLGKIKKTNLSKYKPTKRKSGTKGITLKDNDEVVQAFSGNESRVLLASRNGMAIVIDTTDIRAQGRIGQGVKGIVLSDDSYVIGGTIVDDDTNIYVISTTGLGNGIYSHQLYEQRKGGKGIRIYKNDIAAVIAATPFDNLYITGDTADICIQTADIPFHQRTAAGVIITKNNTPLSANLIL